MKKLTLLILVASISGCSVGGQRLEFAPAAEVEAPKNVGRVSVTKVDGHGAVNSPLGGANISAKVESCVVNTTGTLPLGTMRLKNGDCEFNVDSQ